LKRKTLDIITLFHKPNSAASSRVVTLLKQVSANSSSSATIDQASDHSAQTSPRRREEFQLDITESPPTADQLQTILGYVGPRGISSIIEGAVNEQEALKKFRANPDTFKRPVVRFCTWEKQLETVVGWSCKLLGPLQPQA
jgi:hypothetical protein